MTNSRQLAFVFREAYAGGPRTITGSFNFTKAAEGKNAENLLVIKGNAELAKKYLANFEEHLRHSEKYQGLNR